MWGAEGVPDGWLSEGQAFALWRAAASVRPGAWIVEIGSHHGRSTVFLASGKQDDVPMLAVDPFDSPRWGGGAEAFESFHDTVCRFGLADVAVFRGLSREASAAWTCGPVGLLFIDGAHDRSSVLADIDGWEPTLAPGALVFVHDAFSSVGVTSALTSRYLFTRSYRYVGSTRSLVAFVREPIGGVRAVAQSARLLPRYAYFARNVAIKVSLRRGWGLVRASCASAARTTTSSDRRS